MAHVLETEQMAVDVRGFHDVVVNERDVTDPRPCKLLDDRAAEGSRTEHDNALGLSTRHLRKLVPSDRPIWVNSLDQHRLEALPRPSTDSAVWTCGRMDRWWTAGQRKCEGAVMSAKQSYSVFSPPLSTYALVVKAMEVRCLQPCFQDAPQRFNVSWPRRWHEGMRDGNIGDENAALRGRVSTERLDKPLHKRIVVRACHDEPNPLEQQTFSHLRSARNRVNGPDLASSIVLSRKAADINLPVVLRLFREVFVELSVCPRDKKLLLETDKEALHSLERCQASPGPRFTVDAKKSTLFDVRHLKHCIRREADARDCVVRKPFRKDDVGGRNWPPRRNIHQSEPVRGRAVIASNRRLKENLRELVTD
ncbi:hypothetical protein UW163_04215 [Ralstonia solanacearum]|nr:hypothetical protein UW163_04215 [Ralstonia solanacearum]